jgi:AhpD family alkylhydroperoxidase
MKAESNDEWSSLTAPQALASYAPVATDALNNLIAATATIDGQSRPVALFRELCAETLSLTALSHGTAPAFGDIAGWRTANAYSENERVGLAFAEQFSIDVSAIDDDSRAAFQRVFGGEAFAAALAIYIADFTPRLRRALEQIFRPANEGWAQAASQPAVNNAAPVDRAAVFMEFIRVVYNMHGIDPVTTELVRLRGARQHQCRMCKSLRAHSALAAGADEAAFAAVDDYADSDLSARQKAALALADAMIWQPAHIPAAVIADIRVHFTPAEAVELVLDIMRNAANKSSVALATDAAASESVQVYDIDEAGAMHVGLDRPAVVAAAG